MGNYLTAPVQPKVASIKGIVSEKTAAAEEQFTKNYESIKAEYVDLISQGMTVPLADLLRLAAKTIAQIGKCGVFYSTHATLFTAEIIKNLGKLLVSIAKACMLVSTKSVHKVRSGIAKLINKITSFASSLVHRNGKVTEADVAEADQLSAELSQA